MFSQATWKLNEKMGILVVWPSVSYLTILSLNFILYKMEKLQSLPHRTVVRIKWVNIYIKWFEQCKAHIK